MKAKRIVGMPLVVAVAACGGGGSNGGGQYVDPGSSGAGSGSGGGSGGSGSGSGGSGSGGNSSSGGYSSSGSSGNSGTSSGSVLGSSSGNGGGDATTGSSSGTTSSSGSSSGVMTTGSGPTIPAVSGTCPTLATGNITVLGQSVQLFVGAKQSSVKGSVLFYWHGTGGSSSEAQVEMGTQITEITGQGGIVASFSTSTKMGTDTGDAVWYTGDFAMADQILACAVQQLNIDTRRIYTAGCSAGGLQAGAMVYGRNEYLAASMPNSGGVIFAGTLNMGTHVPAVVTTHGGSTDNVVVSFATTSATLDNDIKAKGGFVVDCNHGGGHCGAPAADIAGQWQFCKDHPFGVSPEPYASGLPASLPTYCTKI